MYGFRERDQSYDEMVVWISAGYQVNNMKNDSILVKCPFAGYLNAKFRYYCCEMKLFTFTCFYFF